MPTGQAQPVGQMCLRKHISLTQRYLLRCVFQESRRLVDTAGVGIMQTEVNISSNRLLTETEACEYLRVRPRQLFNWRMSGLVPFIRIGRAIRFRVIDLDAAIDRMTINPIQPFATNHNSNPSQGHENVL